MIHHLLQIFTIFAIVCLSANITFAMNFSNPVKVGTIVAANIGGFAFRDGAFNTGSLAKNAKRGAYERGVARFSEGSDALYFHYYMGTYKSRYNDRVMLFGSKNINNTIKVPILFAEVARITNDMGLTMYVIHDSYDLPEENSYTLIGLNREGKWVKYFDSDSIAKQYFGKPEKVWSDNSIWFDNLECQGDTVIIQYHRYHRGLRNNKSGYVKEGEFRFKWDDVAQWFGVEQVVY